MASSNHSSNGTGKSSTHPPIIPAGAVAALQSLSKEDNTICLFWKVPVELRDMVYELVYGERRTIRVASRDLWTDSETLRRRCERSSYSPKPFPESAFSHILVSKQYLDEAARVFVRTKIFDFTGNALLIVRPEYGCTINQQLLTHIRCLKINRSLCRSLDIVEALPNFTFLEVEFGSGDLDVGEKLPGLDEFSDVDLIKSRPIANLLRLRGLREVVVSRKNEWIDLPEEEEQRFCRLLGQVQQLVSEVVTKPRDKTIAARAPNPAIPEILANRSTYLTARRTLTPYGGAFGNTKVPLEDSDVPNTESAFVRLFFSRPNDVFDWIQGAKQRLAEQP